MNPLGYSIMVFFIVIVATLIVGYISNRLLTKIVRKSTEGMTKDPTNYKFLKHVSLACIYLVGFSLAI